MTGQRPVLDEWIDHDEGVRVIKHADSFEYAPYPAAASTSDSPVLRGSQPDPCEARDQASSIPAGVYYSEEHANFYTFDGRGMGTAFWQTWRGRSHEFPQGSYQ